MREPRAIKVTMLLIGNAMGKVGSMQLHLELHPINLCACLVLCQVISLMRMGQDYGLFIFLSLVPTTVTSLCNKEIWTELIMKPTFSVYIERISLSSNCSTLGYMCCLDVQNFAKMTVSRHVYLHGLNLAVIDISHSVIHLSYLLH